MSCQIHGGQYTIISPGTMVLPADNRDARIRELTAIVEIHRQGEASHKERVRVLDLQIEDWKKKDKAFEDATVKNLEAVTDLLEALSPFYLHGKALRNENILNVAPLKEISRVGSSHLVGGAFLTAIEAYEKWGEVGEAVTEKPVNATLKAQYECSLCGKTYTGQRTCHPYADKRVEEPPKPRERGDDVSDDAMMG